MKRLYFGDCLAILKELHAGNPDGFIDLIYIDPPFNSKRDYNILFESVDLTDSTAQKHAFADTWSNVSYLDALNEIQQLDLDLFRFLKGLDEIRIPKSAIAYLTTMAIRIYYMHKVLKNTGSFYLHCDPTMSHYLKIVCDLVFGHDFFQSEIVWRRTGSHNKLMRFGPIHDIILYYTKSSDYTWTFPKRPYMNGHIQENFVKDAKGYKTNYYGNVLTGSGIRNGESGEPWRGFNPTKKHRHWAIPGALLEDMDDDFSSLTQHQKLDRLYELGCITITKGQAWPIYERYLKPNDGQLMSDIWAFQPYTNGTVFGTDKGIDEDVRWLSTKDQERLGYPTQKPESLLERIITASSKEGDTVADFFCGCGTTIAAAERLNRNWLGVDISHLAIRLITKRLTDPYRGNKAKMREILDSIQISGIPKDIASARELASETEGGRFDFQDWVVEVMMGGVCNPKKVADGGWDGYLTFNTTDKDKDIVLVEVKSGNVNVKNVREFIQVVDSKKAAIGVFVCFQEQVTKPMQLEAKHAGYYKKEVFVDQYDKIQILTIEDLFDGKTVKMPESTKGLFKTAKKGKFEKESQGTLFTSGSLGDIDKMAPKPPSPRPKKGTK